MKLSVTNLTGAPLTLPYLEMVIPVSGTAYTNCAQSDLSRFTDLHEAVASGRATYAVAATAAEMASGVLTSGLPLATTTSPGLQSSDSVIPALRYSNAEVLDPYDWPGSVILDLSAEDLSDGKVATWRDHRYYAGSSYGSATQATGVYQPTKVVDSRGMPWVQVRSGNDAPVFMSLPAAVNTAMSGSGSGFGQCFVVALVKLYQSVPSTLYGAVENSIMQTGGAASTFLGMDVDSTPVNYVVGHSTLPMARIGLRLNSYAAVKDWGGCQNTCVFGGSYSATKTQLYAGGMMTSVALPGGPYAQTSASLGNTGGHLANFEVNRFLVLAGGGDPTLQHFKGLEAYLLKQARRRVLWDGNSILGSHLSPGSFPYYVEAALGAAYQHDNRGIGSQSTFDVLNRFDQETAKRLRPGDVYALFEGGNSINQGVDNAAAIIAQMTALCAKAKALGASTVIGTFPLWLGWNATQNGYGATVNAAIKSKVMGNVGVADIAADARLQDPSSAVYFDQTTIPHGVHLTDAGSQVAAPYWSAEIRRIAPV